MLLVYICFTILLPIRLESTVSAYPETLAGTHAGSCRQPPPTPGVDRVSRLHHSLPRLILFPNGLCGNALHGPVAQEQWARPAAWGRQAKHLGLCKCSR